MEQNMENLNLAETLRFAAEMEAAAAGMAQRCSHYREDTRALHRELEYLLQLHHREPGIFTQNADINRCAIEFFKTSAQIAQDAQKVQTLGLDKAEKNLRFVQERLAHPADFENPELVVQINALLKSSEENIQLARRYVNQLNTYVQYHARVLKGIKLD